VGKRIKGVLRSVFHEAQVEMEKALSRHTVADILNDVNAQAGN
jgi:hypothetical protein